MAKKKKSVSATRQELRLIAEAKRQTQAMINYWKLRADRREVDKLILKKQQEIAKLQEDIEKIQHDHSIAQEKLRSLRGAFTTLDKRKATIANRDLVEKLKKIRLQMKDLENSQ